MPRSRLVEVIIPAGVTSIGHRVFENATSLLYITIPASVTSIGERVFYGWAHTQVIYMQGRSEANAPAGWAQRGGDATVIWGA